MDRERLLREVAARGKYAPLYRHLSANCGAEWRASFCEVEAILGFRLPDALSRSGDACVRTRGARADRRAVPEAQIRRRPGLAAGPGRGCPPGFTVGREQIYDESGRLTGGQQDGPGNGR